MLELLIGVHTKEREPQARAPSVWPPCSVQIANKRQKRDRGLSPIAAPYRYTNRDGYWGSGKEKKEVHSSFMFAHIYRR